MLAYRHIPSLAEALQQRIPEQTRWNVAQIAFQAMTVIGRDVAYFIFGIKKRAGWADKAAVVGCDDAGDAEFPAKTGGQQLFSVGMDDVGVNLEQGIAERYFVADLVYIDTFVVFDGWRRVRKE